MKRSLVLIIISILLAQCSSEPEQTVGLNDIYNNDPFAYLIIALSGGAATGIVVLIIAAIWDYYSD